MPDTVCVQELSPSIFSTEMILITTSVLVASIAGLIPPIDVQLLSNGLPPFIPRTLLTTESGPMEADGFLTLDPLCSIHSSEFGNTTFTGEIISSSHLTLCSESTFSVLRPGGNTSTVSWVGIGPGSDLLRSHGAISLLKGFDARNASLVVGESSLDQFHQSCTNGTILRFPHRSTINGTVVDIGFRWIWPTGDNGQPYVIEERPRSPVILGGQAKLVTISVDFALPIVAIILTSGAVRNGPPSSMSFTNCDLNILAPQLPNLVVTFDGTEGFLTLYPDDYIWFHRSANECYLNFGIPPAGTDISRFNPLVIPNVNSHITNEEMLICGTL